MAKITKKTSTAKGTKRYTMTGGPLDGHRLWLCSPGTFTFRLKGWNGRYDYNNKWVELS